MLLSLDVLSFISTLDRKDRNLNRLHLVNVRFESLHVVFNLESIHIVLHSDSLQG